MNMQPTPSEFRPQNATRAGAIRCRVIEERDVEDVIDLLTRGFNARHRSFWERALDRIRCHHGAEGYPKYGYLLDRDGEIVGVLLLIFTTVTCEGVSTVRCSVSSWYVEPEVRSHASMLVSRALKHKDVVYLNTSPMPHTLPILEAQGYRPLSRGVFTAIPALARPVPRCRVTPVGPHLEAGPDLSAEEVELLVAHAAWGCISVVCEVDGTRVPFVFLPQRFRRLLPYAGLVYCRGIGDVVRFAGSLGRHLLRHGQVLAMLDSNGPITGLTGRYWQMRPKFYRGRTAPRLGDLAYTEMVLLGL